MNLTNEILGKVQSIPPLSQAAQSIIGLMADAEHDTQKVARVIECDAALTARLLAVVNSAAFALAEPVTTVSRAVMCLGDKVVMGIALDFCTQGVLQQPLEGYCSQRGMLWEHNLRVGIAAKAVAQCARTALNPDVAFTGGILHDIGKLVISDFLKESSGDVIQQVDRGQLPDFLAGEQHTLGTNHCIIGAALARLWKLPSPFPEIIQFHHHPAAADAQHQGVTYAVHVGDIIAMMAGIGTGSDTMCYQLDPHFSRVLDLPAAALIKVMSAVEDEFQKAKALLFGGACT